MSSWGDSGYSHQPEIPLIGWSDAVKTWRNLGYEVRYYPLIPEIQRCAKEDDFFFCCFWGKQRKGKSSGAFQCMWHVYGDWDEVFDNVVYGLPEMVEMMYHCFIKEISIPVVTWDDIAVHAGKRTKSRETFFKIFSEMFDAIGTVIHSLLVTAVRPDATVPALRERYIGEVVFEPRGHFNYCTLPNTIMIGENKKISDVKVGDQVVGMSGFQKALQTHSRHYEGDLITIRAKGCLPMTVTPNHPILTVQPKIDSHFDTFGFTRPSWKEADSILVKRRHESGDYLMLPKLQGSSNAISLDLRQFMHRSWKPDRIPLNENVAWLMGLYVAEGSANLHNGLQFSIAKKEKALACEITRIADKTGYKTFTYENKQNEGMNVVLMSSILARAFQEWFGKSCYDKRVPDFILNHNFSPIISNFVRGWEEGDGSNSTNHGYRIMAGATVSPLLAIQLQLLYARLGVFLNIYPRDGGVSTINDRQVHASNWYYLRYLRNPCERNSTIKSSHDCFLVPVKSICRTHYNGEVCNVATEDNTFLISNLITHNCYYDWRLAYYYPGQPYFVKVWIEEGDFQPMPKAVYETYRPERMRLLRTKFMELYDSMYQEKGVKGGEVGGGEDAVSVALDHISVDLLKVLEPVPNTRTDSVKRQLVGQGYERTPTDMAIARLQAHNFVVKKGQFWSITPRGRQALDKARKEGVNYPA